MAAGPEGSSMSREDTRKAGKATVDMAPNAVGVWTRGAQAIAIEVIDYAGKTNESSAAAEAAKVDEIYVEFAGEAHAPLRTAFAEPHACT